MDLERIKQNFRIRSGRSRKTKRPPKSQSNPQPPVNASSESSKLPNGTPIEPAHRTPEQAKEELGEEAQATQENETQDPRKPEAEQGPETPVKSRSHPEEESTVAGKETTEDTADAPNDTTEPSRNPLTSTSGDSTTNLSRRQSLGSEDSSLELQDNKPAATMTDPQISTNATSSDAEDFDLAPPKRRPKQLSLETLSELLFSSEHLDALLHHPQQLARFSGFLQKYVPHLYPYLAQYLETRKAIKAIEYANALAEGLRPMNSSGDSATTSSNVAAKLDPEFEAVCTSSFEALVGDALPSFVSYALIKTVSECLTNEITGRSTPVMQGLVDGLSEVFCLTDPNQEDNPIIYASEEFYRLTRYGPDDVINHNCRFLQGRKTNLSSHKRLSRAIKDGEEITETLLNYRRDGRPFINLLMVAPLHDRHGKLKYHIGAQVDVSKLVEGGRALDSFQRCLSRRTDQEKEEAADEADKNLDDDQRRKKRALRRLRDLSETFDLEETAVVQATSRANSVTRDADDNASMASVERQKGHRRVFVEDEVSDYDNEDAIADDKDSAAWKLGEAGDGRLSGKLPGLYDSFMLFRPGPSLRIVFVSPKLRKIGDVLQSPFMSHVAAPTGTLSGLSQSLKAGVPVSAKIHFKPERSDRREGTKLPNGTKHEDGKNGRAIWVSCTPLLGEDDRVGVWMCVVVEKSKVGAIHRKRDGTLERLADDAIKSVESTPTKSEASGRQREDRPRYIEMPNDKSNVGSETSSLRREDIPIKPVRVDSQTVIKAQVEKSPENKEVEEAGQDQSSKAVRPQQSIYFDAEQGDNNDKEDDITHLDKNNLKSDETVTRLSPLPPSTPERDPRAVITPVEEYAEPEGSSHPYSVELPDVIDALSDYGEDADDYITTRSPMEPPRQVNGRVLIEEDSDVLQDSDLDHQRENMDVGRKRDEPQSPDSLNSPASDIPPSIPSSHIGEDDANEIDDPKVETPITARHNRSPSPPQAEQENDYSLEESHATIKPTRNDSRERNSDNDSAISINSPAQHRKKPKSKSSRGEPEADADQEAVENPTTDDSEYENNEETEARTHERDVETWVKEGRPATSRNNSDNHKSNHAEGHSRGQSSSNVMDYLRSGSNRWRAGQAPRIETDFEKGGYMHMHMHNDEDDDMTTNTDHCARSPYSVD